MARLRRRRSSQAYHVCRYRLPAIQSTIYLGVSRGKPPAAGWVVWGRQVDDSRDIQRAAFLRGFWTALLLAAWWILVRRPRLKDVRVLRAEIPMRGNFVGVSKETTWKVRR